MGGEASVPPGGRDGDARGVDKAVRSLSAVPEAGVGTALLAKARQLSPRELRLYTFQRNNAARAFYEHMDSQRSRSGISPAPEFEPDVEYRWQADTDAEG